MYSCFPQIVLGFHGCDKDTAEDVLKADKSLLKKSNNTYDWLGSGIYFWENNSLRAKQYAIELKKRPLKNRPKITTPFAIGAVINLGKCFNLLDNKYIEYLKYGYKLYVKKVKEAGLTMPVNKPIGKTSDLLLRHLDCAVIDFTLNYLSSSNGLDFDSVRGMFKEGYDIYPQAGFQEKNHIQISIRNPNCIKGYFRIIRPDNNYPSI